MKIYYSVNSKFVSFMIWLLINKDKDWFSPDYPEAGFIFKDRRVSAYYIGYFEILHKLQIEYINTEDDDLVFEP